MIITLSFLPFPHSASAQTCDPWVAKIVSSQGPIEAKRATKVSWEEAAPGNTYCAGAQIRVEDTPAIIRLVDDSIIKLDAHTTMSISAMDQGHPSVIELLRGLLHFISRVPQRLTIKTPIHNASVEGTEFVFRVDANEATLSVFEGQVLASNTFGSLRLTAGQVSVTKKGEAPQLRLDLHPRDAVQWALYYPPLIDFGSMRVEGPSAPTLEGAMAMYNAGKLVEAMEQLESVPPDRRDIQFFAFRAGVSLSMGRVIHAQDDITAMQRLDPTNATAKALQSVIAMAQNDKAAALSLAREAVTQDETALPESRSPVPYVALSYAHQAAFDIDAALAATQKAMELAPHDALIRARLAELWLSKGDLSRAEKAAKQAVQRNPDLARTQTVLGFAKLTRMKPEDAMVVFERAIALDPGDPLPRLGLGLAKIREGDVEEGRAEIEVAASLDPNNSLIRSYLGKAYFEERRDGQAESQLARAKELDPNDPTPYFYDAIRKQTINRPVEALHDLQKSIELNENRGVYRSKMLLDSDDAARSASLGRIYKDLGFERRALFEGWKSVNKDQSNHSGHRLLADSYASQPRHGVARVSELLQSQLLQPLNINNVQPQLQEHSLQILEGAGPSALSFNEFNPLFMRDRVALQANGLVGNNDVLANDAVLSGIEGPISWSLGQFHYESDGFRENSDAKHDLYNVFVQGQVTPNINLQAEYRKRNTDQGDLELSFDPNDFLSSSRREIEQDTARFGGRISPSKNSDIIASFIYGSLEDTLNDPGGIPASVNIRQKDEALQGEAQYLFRHRLFQATAGGGRYHIDRDARIRVGAFTAMIPNPVPPPPFLPFDVPASEITSTTDIDHTNAYLYLQGRLFNQFTWTGGLSYDNVDDQTLLIDSDKISPKLGLQWDVTSWAQLRAAYLQTVNRFAVVEQTIEPTQVAGFNQFFDDANATRVSQYGLALDTKFGSTFHGGVEYSHRTLDQPTLDVDPLSGSLAPIDFDRLERLYSAYLYWTPHRYWALSTKFEYDQFNKGVDRFADDNPTEIETRTIPLAARFFHPSGFFAGVVGTFVRQEIDHSPTSTFMTKSDDFFLVDASIGYRFPKRYGILSIEARNLFDQEFLYQDDNIRVAQPINPRFIPDRAVLAKLTLAFN